MSIAIEDTKAGADAVTAWKLVPVEPTEAMLDCIRVAVLPWCRGTYRAMLAAAPTPPPAEGVVGELLAETGSASVEEMADMARVGHSLLDAIASLVKCDGPFKGWMPSNDPAEIVTELENARHDAIARAEAAEAELASIKAGPIVYGIVPPLHERIVRMAQGDEVARLRDAAAEDERDRLFQIAEDRQEDTSDDDRWKQAVEAGCFLDDHGAMLPAARAVIRATQEKPQGIPAGKEG